MTNRERNHFFAEQNIDLENRANVLLYTIHCLPLIFARTYSPLGISFFRQKTSLCLSKGPLPRRKSCELRTTKTCSQNMANTNYTLFAVCQFFIVSPLFRRCSQIVYNGLYESFTDCIVKDQIGSNMVREHTLSHIGSLVWPFFITNFTKNFFCLGTILFLKFSIVKELLAKN